MADSPHGETTLDILALGKPHPAEAGLHPKELEAAVRKSGARYRWTGLGLIAAVFFTAITRLFLAGGQVYSNPNAQILAGLASTALLATGVLFAAYGFAEQGRRPDRAMQRQILAQVTTTGERLDRLERGMDTVAEHLPEVLRIREWRGFNDAVREGFQPTGTTGDDSRRRRLGVVPNSTRGPRQTGPGSS